jgi:hypothetical protein
MVPAIISGWDLDTQQRLFKPTMKFNAIQPMAKVLVSY